MGFWLQLVPQNPSKEELWPAQSILGRRKSPQLYQAAHAEPLGADRASPPGRDRRPGPARHSPAAGAAAQAGLAPSRSVTHAPAPCELRLASSPLIPVSPRAATHGLLPLIVRSSPLRSRTLEWSPAAAISRTCSTTLMLAAGRRGAGGTGGEQEANGERGASGAAGRRHSEMAPPGGPRTPPPAGVRHTASMAGARPGRRAVGQPEGGARRARSPAASRLRSDGCRSPQPLGGRGLGFFDRVWEIIFRLSVVLWKRRTLCVCTSLESGPFSPETIICWLWQLNLTEVSGTSKLLPIKIGNWGERLFKTYLSSGPQPGEMPHKA